MSKPVLQPTAEENTSSSPKERSFAPGGRAVTGMNCSMPVCLSHSIRVSNDGTSIG